MLLRRASDKDGYAEDRFYSMQTASSAGRGYCRPTTADLTDIDETSLRRKLKLKASAIYFSNYRRVPLSVFALGKH
jgi:hypothetical protein